MRLLPKAFGSLQRVDFDTPPPDQLVARLMQLTVVTPAKRNGEFIAHLEAYRSRLSKPQVMRITGLPAANQTGLRSDEFQMCLVAKAFRFGNCQRAFINMARDQCGGGRDKRCLVRQLIFRVGSWAWCLHAQC